MKAFVRFLMNVYSGLKRPAVLAGFLLIGAAWAWVFINRAHILTPIIRPTDGDITATLYVPPLDLFMGRFPEPVRYTAFWFVMLSPVIFLAAAGAIFGKKKGTYL